MDSSNKERVKEQIDSAIDSLFAEIDNGNKKVAALSFTHGNGGQVLIKKDPAFEKWAKKYIGEEEDPDPNTCPFCFRSPCIVDQEHENVVELCEPLEEAGLQPREIRYQLYRHFIDALYGRLGKRNRKELPKCVVSEIHDSYPQCDHNYVGFREVADSETEK